MAYFWDKKKARESKISGSQHCLHFCCLAWGLIGGLCTALKPHVKTGETIRKRQWNVPVCCGLAWQYLAWAAEHMLKLSWIPWQWKLSVVKTEKQDDHLLGKIEYGRTRSIQTVRSVFMMFALVISQKNRCFQVAEGMLQLTSATADCIKENNLSAAEPI